VLAAGLHGLAVRLWDVPSGRQRTRRGGHTWQVTSLAFSRDGNTIFSSANAAVRSWEVATGKKLRRFEEVRREGRSHRSGGLVSILSPNGRYLAWREAGYLQSLQAVEVATGQEVAAMRAGSRSSGIDAVFAGNETSFAVLSSARVGKEPHNAVQTWDLTTGQAGRRITFPEGPDAVRLALSPNARSLAIAVDPGHERRTGELALWDLASGKQFAHHRLNDHVTALAFSPDGTLLAVACRQGVVRLWDVATGNELRHLGDGKALSTGALAFSPDGRTLAITSQEQRENETTVLVWELASGQVRARFAGHRGGVTALAFSPDSRLLASGGDDTTILLWDVTGRTGPASRRKGKPAPDEIAGLWADLDSAAAVKAHRAMARLLAVPAETLTLFRKELKPATGKALSEKEVQRLIGQLANDSFEVRQNASQALKQEGQSVRPALLAALKASTDLEKKRRLEELLKALTPSAPVAEWLRPARALEVLEQLGSPEAKRLLETLSKGRGGARLTVAATATLKRLPRVP
jgi:hypothetical protein